MFKRKKKEKVKVNKKPLAERIIGFIFVALIVAYFGYSIVMLVKNMIVGVGDLDGLNSSLSKLSSKAFDKSCLVYEKNISGEDLASFYAKTGSSGANINIFTSGNFDYSKYSNENLSFSSSFSLTGNELGVFMNNVFDGASFSLIDKILEIQITPIENSTRFYLKSIAKLDLSILEEVSKDSVGEIYLRTQSEVAIVGQGLVVYDSSVLVNNLTESENAEIISELDSFLKGDNNESNTSNYVTYEIKNFIKDFRRKTNCGILRNEIQILFNK